MTTVAQRRAVTRHRQKASAQGLARVEVQVPKIHSALLRRIAETLRNDPAAARHLSEMVGAHTAYTSGQTLGEFFDGLPDISGPEFDEVFELGQDRSLPEDIEL
ncbi:hypothetical protein [Chthonobacter albigriseus]|uniref:hypothetical protein n=1 Tax=Chthonobacter albigriseus TaxID=1683161 RepID=UPI0015EFA01A|nr:hypothetical protein [Chthonobacter albigriseus]